jgi:hypothetical protein
MLEMRAPAVVQVICDLRHFYLNIDSERKMDELWETINERLVGRELRNGGELGVYLDRGKLVRLWVVDAQGQTKVTPDTIFHITDIVRNPQLVYRCRTCNKYGPFRCMDCMDTRPRGQERLCSTHAKFVEGRWRAYCDAHLPACRCFSWCKDTATFCCEHCNGFYGEHYRTSHPHDKTIDYCKKCYDRLFGHCSVCLTEGRSESLGTLRCAFKSREMAYPCGEALCWKHALQWRIWGPHQHGITLCERHKQLIRNSDPKDVLTMMITTRSPRSRRGKSFSLANLYRLRRLLNRDRTGPLSFEEIVETLHALSRQSEAWDKYAQQRYKDIVNSCDKMLQEIPIRQNEMLAKVREYYWDGVNKKAAQAIAWLTIEDRYVRPGQPDLFFLAVHLNTPSKRPYIGIGGDIIKRIESQLGARLEFWDITVTPPRRID